jgi:putative colanic acid biosynthesis glycosyltransferase
VDAPARSPSTTSDPSAVAPVLSIVTVNLNDAWGLRATAASLLAQSYQGYEWLILDGASTDGSLEVLRELDDAADGWWSAPDHGVYDAMNRGLGRARGQYVLFLNSGDRLAGRRALERAIRTLLERPGLDLLFFGTVLELRCGRRRYRPPRSPVAWLRFGLPGYHQSTLVRRLAHQAAPFDLTLQVSAEYGAIATLLTHGASAGRVHMPLAVRRCHPGSISERVTARRFADFVQVQRTVLGLSWPAVGLDVARLALIHLAYRAWRRERSNPADEDGRGNSSYQYDE